MIPRYVIVPTHNRPKWIVPLVETMALQADAVVVVDNASTPPLNLDGVIADIDTGCQVVLIRDEEQPPNLSRFWNLMFDRCKELAADAGAEQWDVAVLNDDVLLPFGWLAIVSEALRGHPTAVIAHTGTGRVVREPRLLTELDNDMETRMCPHAFVIRGEVGLRADETMRWWYQDTDIDWQARLAGGVLAIPGPRVSNALANTTTVGVLREQAQRDEQAFMTKWQVRA